MRTFYESLPGPVKAIGGPVARSLPLRMRYGSAFVSALHEAHRLEWAGPEEQAAAADAKLRALSAAAVTSPYWRRVFRDCGVPDGPHDAVGLERLPLISKDEVAEHTADMLTSSSALRKWVTTGGTSGQQLGLWIDKDSSARDWAYTVNAWGRVGFRPDSPRVVLRGRALGAHGRDLFEYEPLRRELYVSVFDLDGEHLPAVRDRLRDVESAFLHGYPSAMLVLARSYVEAGETPPAFRALLATSEGVHPEQRQRLEEVFGARVFSFYGMTEKGAFAAECECSTQLHVEPGFGIVELLDRGGNRITEPGLDGEVTVTGLLSCAQPLLRYRTGDFARWASGPCKCGRHARRLESVDGRRMQELLVGRNGAPIPMTGLNMHSRVFDHVRRYMFVQDVPGIAVAHIEPGAGYGEEDTALILRELGQKLSGQVDLTVELVNRIPTTPRGKARFIDQHLDVSGLL